MREFLTEDVVRDNAGKILGLEDSDVAISGIGQLTSFIKLGFDGVKDRPDGWYLPKNRQEPAIILETKNSDQNLNTFNPIRSSTCLPTSPSSSVTNISQVAAILHSFR